MASETNIRVQAHFDCSYSRCAVTGTRTTWGSLSIVVPDPSVVQHERQLNATIHIAPCLVGEYRENEKHLIEVRGEDEDGEEITSQKLVDTGRVKACVTCPRGKYSDEAGVSECKDCPIGAECPGGPELIPDAGYWKPEASSGLIYKCVTAGCLGESMAGMDTG